MKTRTVPLAAFALVAACFDSGGDGGPGGTIIRAGEIAGSVSLDGDSGAPELWLYASFFTEITPADLALVIPGPSDECVLDEDGPIPAVDSITFRDMGPTLTAVGASATVSAPRDTSQPPEIFYEGFTPGPFTPGSFSIEAGTTMLGTIVVPAEVVLLNPNEPIVPGQPLDLAFTPDTGASYIEIYLEDEMFEISYTCYSADDGTFTVPGDITNELGENGYFDVSSGGSFSIEILDGKKVLLFGYNF